MKQNFKTKGILFKLEMGGRGIVNYDGPEQKFVWGRESKKGNKNQFASINNNLSLAKKVYTKSDEDVLEYLIKISSNAFKFSLYSEDAVANTSSIQHNPILFNSSIASFNGIVRGYLYTGDNIFKRKSPLTIVDIIQSNNAQSSMELFTKSGAKVTKTDVDDKGGTSLFIKETIGDITYQSFGEIDISELQFVSADPIFDRTSFNSDDFEIYKMFLKKHFDKLNPKLGYYKLKTANADISEFGYTIDNETMIDIIKVLLYRLLTVKIKRNNAIAFTSKVLIKYVNDPLKDTLLNPDGWVEIATQEDIDNISFDMDDKYIPTNTEDAIKQRKDTEEYFAKEKAKTKQAKLEKKKIKNKKTEPVKN